MENKIIEKTEALINEIIENGINMNNIEYLYKISKINHMAKEDKCMNYGNYGRAGYNAYGDNYGRRVYDMKYRGEEELDRMAGEYGRYMESRRYGAGEESDKSFHYMIKALEDFVKVLRDEAETSQQKQMLRETLQRIM